MRVAIYARVSTTDQDVEVQLKELRPYVERRGWELVGEFVDRGHSGAKARRPALDQLMGLAQKRKVDVILVWALDRLGRSLRHLVQTCDELGGLGVDLVSYTQHIDTTSPSGKLTFGVLAAVAEFERAMLRERVLAGLRNARANGVRLGRRPVAVDVGKARELLAAGMRQTRVAQQLGVSPRSLMRSLQRAIQTSGIAG